MAKRLVIYNAPPATQDLAGYPALRHFFPCDEASGTTLHCAKTGLIFTPFELEFNPTLGTVRPNKTYATYQNDGPVSNGNWATFGAAEYLLHMFVIKVREYIDATTVEQKLRVRCRIGPLDDASLLAPGNGHKWGTSTRGNLHVALTGSGGNDGWITGSPLSLDATFYDRTIAVYSKVSPYVDGFVANKEIGVLGDKGESIGLVSSQSSGSSEVPGNLSPSSQAGWTGGDFYGSSWFAFQNGYPADLEFAIKWMTNCWVQGKRLIYPRWQGVV